MKRYRASISIGIVLLVSPASIAGCSSRHTAGPTPKEIAATEKMTSRGCRILARSTTLFTGVLSLKQKGIDELKKMGIDTIVDLRGERHGLMEKERKHAESLGMRLVNIPGYGWASPSDKEMAQFFALVNEKPQAKNIHSLLAGRRPRWHICRGLPDCI